MVFHHVRHVEAALRELRRVISRQGLLVIREHDCRSAAEAVFLDITHGLYSLALSDPIEWPAFIDEYNAWYRSRDQWNELMSVCGFTRLDRPATEKHYNASLQNLTNMPPLKNIPNVIKAYYAVYVPSPNYVSPVIPLKTVSDASTTADTVSSSTKRQKVDHTNEASNIPSNTTVSSHTSSPPNGNDLWVVYESSKHHGHFYVIDPVTSQTHWVTGGVTPFPTGGPSTAQQQTASVGEFMNPITKAVSQIKRINYASKT